jgi:iron complex transport system permease protein
MLKSHRAILLLLAVAWFVVAGLSLRVGTTGVTVWHYWEKGQSAERPVVQFLADMASLPLPRLAMGTLAGAGLAMAGAMFQALFRNPLASPSTLGVSSGASLGATIALLLTGGGLWLGIPKVSLAAFAGAMICVAVVYVAAGLRRGQSTGVLLLAGITVGLICSAMIVVVLFLATQHDLTQILRWMMGTLEVVRFDPVYEALAMIAPAVGVAVYLHRDLDLLMMGEDAAAGRGVPVRRSRRLVYFAASLLTAGIVAQCGPIGFIGLIVPHAMRFLVGPLHRRLLPACALAGAAFLPLCDLLARNAMYWYRDEARQVPVGVLTNIIGGLFFLYLLLGRRRPTL